MYESVNKIFNELLAELTNNKNKQVSISDFKTSELQKYRVSLRLRKEINNTENSILGELKFHIEEFQKYKLDSTLDKIEKIIQNYFNQTKNMSDIKTNSFLENIQDLSISSKESIVNAEKFDSFSEYIHVKRDIEDELLNQCHKLNEVQTGVILLVGSVGDGKSHLLAYLNNKYPELFENIIIHNDATESNNPSYTASETLEEILDNVYRNERKIIIAINIGMLHNFYSYLKDKESLLNFQNFVDESGILNAYEEAKRTFTSIDNENHSIVSFLEEQNLIIKDGKVTNNFYNRLIDKIFAESDKNPIYASFIKDDGFNRRESYYKNYALLIDKRIQDAIVYILNLVQVQEKRILTARSVLNFLYDIIVPTDTDKDEHSQLLPSLLFESKEKSKLLESISKHDPSKNSIQEFEELNVSIYNTGNLVKICEELFKDDYEKIDSTILYLSNLDNERHRKKYVTIVRFIYLFNHDKFITNNYKNYLHLLEGSDREILKSFLKDLEKVTYFWNESPIENYLYKKPWNTQDNIRVAIEFSFSFKKIEVRGNSISIEIFNIYEENSKNHPYKLEVDYPLYILIRKISEGYMIKNIDRNDAINFNEFMEDLIEKTVSTRNTIIKMTGSNRLFRISSGTLNPEIEELK